MTRFKNGFNKGFLVAVLILMTTALVAGCGGALSNKTEVDIGKYIKISANGRNESGEATYVFGADSVIADYFAQNEETNKDKRYSTELALYSFLESVEITLAPEDSLANGDIIKASVAYDEDLAKELKLKILPDVKDCEVKGLELPGEYNPFDAVKMSFSGTSPYMTASLEKNGETRGGIAYEYPQGLLSNGDTVTVKAVVDEAQFMEDYFDVITETSKDYPVEGAYAYAMTAEDFGKDPTSVLKMQSESIDGIMSTLTKDAYSFYREINVGKIFINWYTPVLTDEDVTPYAVYLLTAKPEAVDTSNNSTVYNRLCLVYKSTFTYPEGALSTGPFEVYHANSFDNIIVDGDTLVVDYQTRMHTWSLNPAVLYDSVVTKLRDSYNVLEIDPAEFINN